MVTKKSKPNESDEERILAARNAEEDRLAEEVQLNPPEEDPDDHLIAGMFKPPGGEIG